jgi:tRNA(Ile2) C34 agmatinyltransferase TiaS
VTDWVGDSGLMRSLSARLAHPFRPGDVLMVTGEVASCAGGVAEMRLSCVNQEGVEIVGRRRRPWRQATGATMAEMGKRYRCEKCGTEVLAIRAGEGS